MAYDTNKLYLVSGSVGGGRGQIWVYEDTVAKATVIAGTYISDAQARGMKIGDLLIYRQLDSVSSPTSLSDWSMHAVTAVDSGGATAGSSLSQSAGLGFTFVGPMRSPTLTSAGQTLYRTIAPFAGRALSFRGLVITVGTGASNKLVRLVISGNTVGSGTLTLNHGDAIGTKYGVTMTTDNTIAAGNGVTVQSGAQKMATGVFDFYVGYGV
jgi:hypothetical protein